MAAGEGDAAAASIRALTQTVGFRYAKDATEALRMALTKQGDQARIAVIRWGGHVLPIVDDEVANRVAEMRQGPTAAHHFGSQGADSPPGQKTRPEPQEQGGAPNARKQKS